MNLISLKSSSNVESLAHVAIIMDGNGRWAQARSLPRTAGHKRGAEAARTAVETALRLGIPYLTLFAFSSENWKRPKAEVTDLMGLLRHCLNSELKSLKAQGVRVRIIGDRDALADDIVSQIDEAERQTAHNDRLTLIIALNYGGRAEIAAATRHLAERVANEGLDPASIDEETISHCLQTREFPDPDLLIRTSGEKRISNFLIWQLAYTELLFVDRLWPDFSRQDFEDAVAEYQSRIRRYGAVGA